jgi:hypothetical protein
VREFAGGSSRDLACAPVAARPSTIRLLNVACRTVHIVAFAVLFGGHVWGVEADRLHHAFWATVGSGLALVACEVAADRRWLREVRGAMVLVKLGLLLLVPLAWAHRVALLTAVALIAAVGAHLPGRFRHAHVLPRFARRCVCAAASWSGRRALRAIPRSRRGIPTAPDPRQGLPGSPAAGSAAGSIPGA